MNPPSANKPRFFAPEVIQTSAMDCGPAALKCFLEGFGVSASYGRLREACQTDVDGTSIDTIEEIAVQLGLDAEQVIVPLDHLLLPAASLLPALVVTRLPSKLNHFVIAWRCHWQRVVQVMDPASGRRWPTAAQFLGTVYKHRYNVPAADWRTWAAGTDFLEPLYQRLANLGISDASAEALLVNALEDPGWRSLAALDATTRMVTAIVRAGGIRRGLQAAGVLESFLAEMAAAPDRDIAIVPADYWFVRPAPPDAGGEAQLTMAGAVLIRVRGVQTDSPALTPDTPPPDLSPELQAALTEPPPQPGRELWRLIRADGWLTPAVVLLSLIFSALGTVLEALLFRGLFNLNRMLVLPGQQVGSILIAILFVALITALRYYIAFDTRRLGRNLEIRLRIAFFTKIPRLRDQYFRSRPVSDMAKRGHRIHHLRELPELGMRFLHAVFSTIFISTGIIWLSPGSWPLTLIAASLAIGLPLLFQPAVNERDMRGQTHAGAKIRFFLESMLGLVPIRTHGAERAMRREHESLLIEWARAVMALVRILVTGEGIHLLAIYGITILIIYNHLAQTESTAGVLLLVYWSLLLAVVGQQVTQLGRQYPIIRNITLRVLEPLAAPEDALISEQLAANGEQLAVSGDQFDKGVAISMQNVWVRAAGQMILRDINLSIAPGDQVAIVGESGAGKSSLVGLLLGWHRPAEGNLLVNGRTLNGPRLIGLRQHTSWVDPAVQLWNRSFLENLTYGAGGDHDPVMPVVEQAQLLKVLQRLPDGWQTPLGEGGNLVSGGEGQRVRLARAMLRQNVRLVILDEPFRGLDREQRQELLRRTRHFWSGATLLCITHDIAQTQSFGRVLVMENGQIIEDGHPAELAAQLGSCYQTMLTSEAELRTTLWANPTWRKFQMADGRLIPSDEEKTP